MDLLLIAVVDVVQLAQAGATASADHQKSTTALGRAEAAHRISAAVAERLGLVDATASADHQKPTTALALAEDQRSIVVVVVMLELQIAMAIVVI